ncbi:MAG: putative phosphothreonine lyase domain-containing protein [Candidatus Hydrothermarchaeales archaeon]
MSNNDLPSQNITDWWIFTEGKKNQLHSKLLPEEQGILLIFVERDKIDKIWEIIKNADESGELGTGAKVSTKKATEQSPTSTDKNRHVICVYTRDCNDKEDVTRIREGLKQLGITWKIPYKSNRSTRHHKYIAKGDKRISDYYM